MAKKKPRLELIEHTARRKNLAGDMVPVFDGKNGRPRIHMVRLDGYVVAIIDAREGSPLCFTVTPAQISISERAEIERWVRDELKTTGPSFQPPVPTVYIEDEDED